jgi:dTDP-4-dehydrorhamnose reductase
LSSPGDIPRKLYKIKPDLIVNAAAFTAVDRAESEPELAHTVNAASVAVLGDWACHENAPLIHFSTDYVFDGHASEPYSETASVNPLSVYGLSKAEGEKLLLQTAAPCLIIRTAWRNFLKTIVNFASEREELAVVSDQTGAPTSADQLAKFVHRLVSEGRKDLAASFEKSSRLVHFTAAGWTSWHGFATAIVAGMKRYGIPVKASQVRAIPSSAYPTPAMRPKYSRLSLSRLESVFGYRVEPWDEALDEVLKNVFERARAG